MRVAVVDTQSYWVANGRLWTAPVIGGQIQKHQAEQLDTFSLSNEEVMLILEVLDALSEEE